MKKSKVIFVRMFLALLVTLVVVWWGFDKFANGSKDGWLGFLGGFLGSIIAILGVWWQTNKTIMNEKELMFSQKRPYIILQLLSPDKVDEVYGIEKCDLNSEFQLLAIKNLSNQPFFSIKIIFNDDNSNSVIIDRIDENMRIGIIVNSKDVSVLQEARKELKKSFEVQGNFNISDKKQQHDKAYKKLKSVIGKYSIVSSNELGLQEGVSKMSDDEYRRYLSGISGIVLPKINKAIVKTTMQNCIKTVTIYFTTTVREKVKLVFEEKDGKYKYQKELTKLENKKGEITEEEYDTSDMYESYQLSHTEK